jgi:hypothetical protein
MAEPTDPRGPAATGGAPAEPYPAARPAPFTRDTAEARGYKPLSVTTVVGLSVAVLYALVLAVLAVAAWYSETPLPLAWWPLLVPLAAGVISALGWLQVQRSEGTRAGGRLGLWGLGISLLAGLSYCAYLIAALLALGQEAASFAQGWLDDIREGRMDEAMVKTMPPESRPSGKKGADLHSEVELRFNISPDGSFKGGLTNLSESDPYLALNHGRPGDAAPEVTVRRVGLMKGPPDYRPAGYRVQLGFEFTTPDWDGELEVTLQASENREKGRDWYVVVPETKLTRLVDTHNRLARMDQVLRPNSMKFLREWLQLLEGRQLGIAYIETRLPEERLPLVRELWARQLALTLAPAYPPARAEPLVDTEAGRRLNMPGYARFVAGGLVQPVHFWAPKDMPNAPPRNLPALIPSLARQWFEDPGHRFAPTIKWDEVRMPSFEVKDGRLRLYNRFQGGVMHRYVVDGTIVVDTDARALDDDSETQEWRVAAVELYNGHEVGEGTARPAAPPRTAPPEGPPR